MNIGMEILMPQYALFILAFISPNFPFSLVCFLRMPGYQATYHFSHTLSACVCVFLIMAQSLCPGVLILYFYTNRYPHTPQDIFCY